jgi:NAD(P)-dependent dehydrogenase (short-subunit alcohol dehydrogenase family)
MAKIWLITGSGNGLGWDMAEAALAAGDSECVGDLPLVERTAAALAEGLEQTAFIDTYSELSLNFPVQTNRTVASKVLSGYHTPPMQMN